MFTLKSNIPCENCSKAIKVALQSIPEIKEVDCSVKESIIRIVCWEGVEDESKVRLKVVEELKKSGRKCE